LGLLLHVISYAQPQRGFGISPLGLGHTFIFANKKGFCDKTGKKNEGGFLTFTSHFYTPPSPAIDKLKICFSFLSALQKPFSA